MSYIRVCPRDLFNESKLLKCLGKLSLVILDNGFYPLQVTDDLKNPEKGFSIEKDLSSGDIYSANYHVYLKEQEIELQCLLNSERAYPLIYIPNNKNEDEIFVFNEDGTISTEFLQRLKIRDKE